jgi:hypothetical protein
MTALAVHKARATEALRRYVAEPDDRAKSRHLEAAAMEVAQARTYFTTDDGEPDWGGRTYLYRRFIGDVLTAAGVPKTERPRVTSALRWHVGKALRLVAPPEALADLGLSPDAPEVRAREARARKAVAYQALRPGTDAAEVEGQFGPLRCLEAAALLLGAVRGADIAEADAEVAQEALKASRRALTRIGREVTK